MQKETIIVVSGLPRSGTSMMMELLERGGIPLLTDQARPADDSNPRGYFEFDPVKRLADDAAWLPQAVGKAVKVIHAQLRHLPDNFDYRVLMMVREISEVVRSQETMLGRLGNGSPAISNERMATVFQAQMKKLQNWLVEQPHMSVMDVNYNDLVKEPRSILDELAKFLDRTMDIETMCGVVDPTLYRERSG